MYIGYGRVSEFWPSAKQLTQLSVVSGKNRLVTGVIVSTPLVHGNLLTEGLKILIICVQKCEFELPARANWY